MTLIKEDKCKLDELLVGFQKYQMEKSISIRTLGERIYQIKMYRVGTIIRVDISPIWGNSENKGDDKDEA